MSFLRHLCLVLAALLSAPASAQQAYPTGMVRVVVPYPAGGGVDTMARGLAQRLGRLWGTSVIVDNRPGASTIIGSDFVAKAAPDGLTLLFTTDSSITSNPHLFPHMSFDPLTDLAPITQLIDLPMMVVVHPSVPAKTLRELVALAKAKRDQMNYASFGPGSQPNLLFESLRVQTGARITQIPYKGLAPATTATLAGEVQMTLGGVAISSQYVSAGKLRPLAVTAPERLPQYPDVPTLREAGFPDIDPRSWYGLFAPKNTPAPIIEKIHDDVVRVMNDPEFKEREITSKSYRPVGSTPEAFAAFVKDDFAYKGKMISAAGIKLE